MAISLDALKEQLKLLGHELPEDQIVSILSDMGLGVEVAPAQASRVDHGVGQPSRLSPAGLTLAGQGYEERPFNQGYGGGSSSLQGLSHGYDVQGHATTSVHAHAAYDPHNQLSEDLGRVHIGTGPSMPPAAASQDIGQYHAPSIGSRVSQTVSTAFQTDPYNGADIQPHQFADDAAVAPKQPYEWYGQLAGAAANPHLKLAQPRMSSQRSLLQELDDSASRRAAGAAGKQGAGNAAGTRRTAQKKGSSAWADGDDQGSDGSQEEDAAHDDVLSRLRQLREAFPVAGEQTRGSAGARVAWGPDTQGGQGQGQGQRLGGHSAAEVQRRHDQHRGPAGLYDVLSEEDEEDEDEGGAVRHRRYSDGPDSDSDVRHAPDTNARGASRAYPSGAGDAYLDRGLGGGRGAARHDPPESLHGGRSAARDVVGDRAALRSAAAAAMGPTAMPAGAPGAKPPKYSWQDDLRNASPRSSVLSLPRSHAGTSAGGSRAPSVRSSGATGPKKVDRVKRYQELQQGWSKDKFLQFAQGTKPAPAARQAVPNTRKPLNFHTYFSAMHAMEAADRDQMLKQSRSKTKTELAKGMQYQAPTSKRRDDLRWEVRMKMQGQT